VSKESSDRLDAWLRVAIAEKAATKKLPLVIGIELYEFMDQWVFIREVLGEPDVDGDTEVVVETRIGHCTTTSSGELSLRRPRGA